MRGTVRVSVTAGERVGSVLAAYSTDAGRMNVMQMGNRAGTGSTSVTVQGASMGLTTHTGRATARAPGGKGGNWGGRGRQQGGVG